MDKTRLNVNLDKSIIAKVDEYAETVGITRTGATAVLINMGLQQANAPDILDKMLKLIAETKSLKEE